MHFPSFELLAAAGPQPHLDRYAVCLLIMRDPIRSFILPPGTTRIIHVGSKTEAGDVVDEMTQGDELWVLLALSLRWH
jgi:hypothetical protein